VTKRESWEWHGGTGQPLVMVLQFGLRLGLVDLQWWIQDLPGGGPRRARGGSGDGAPSVVQGLPEPLMGVRGAGKLKAFCSFSYKKWPNVTDLNEKLPPCLRQTASPSDAQPAPSFDQWGRGGGRAAARSAHCWIRHCYSGHFGSGAEVSGHFSTKALRHFGTKVKANQVPSTEKKFREDTPTSPEVIDCNTLNFRPDY